jgi:phosphopantothenoylcysteine decarboxylase/phosphopantothenate--cysteine ligase
VNTKIPSGQKALSIQLKPLPRIVQAVKDESPDTFVIGFKAEFNVPELELIDKAYRRVKEVGLDLMVANDVSKEGVGFSTDTNEVYIVDPDKQVTHVNLTSKRNIATRIFDVALEHYNNKKGKVKARIVAEEKA